MTELESLQQNLIEEITAHRNTKIELQELKNHFAHLELMSNDRPTHLYIQKLLAEKGALKLQIRNLETQIAEIQSTFLPGVSATGIQRRYDFRSKK